MIQFDLSCGILDLKTDEAQKAAELAMQGKAILTPNQEATSSSSFDCDDSDSDTDSVISNHLDLHGSDEDLGPPVSSKASQPVSSQSRRPLIEEL